jgi:hypothetical protein
LRSNKHQPESTPSAATEAEDDSRRKLKHPRLITAAAAALTAAALVACTSTSERAPTGNPTPSAATIAHGTSVAPKKLGPPAPAANALTSLNHKNITATVFWAGEGASGANADITNTASAWVDNWVAAFGGEDKPTSRHNYYPSWGKPRENPFYIAIPFNDFVYDQDKHKPTAELCLEASGNKPSAGSWCKNTWAAVTLNGRTVYAQIEDVGPAFEESAAGEDDVSYVFHGATPRNTQIAARSHDSDNAGAGIDLSPAVRDYLLPGNQDGEGGTYRGASWHFVQTADVPDGPWKQLVTTSSGRVATN